MRWAQSLAYIPPEIEARYDFDLRTGKSEMGLKACTYKVEVRTDLSNGEDTVWVEAPEKGSGWRLIELQPVSEGQARSYDWSRIQHITRQGQCSIRGSSPTSRHFICAPGLTSFITGR